MGNNEINKSIERFCSEFHSDSGYNWMLNYFTDKFITIDNLMLSIDNKILTV